MSDSRLAALWLDALQRLVGGAAHEINNAFNGAVMNLEVVRVRATPGGDAGRVASFAGSAVEQIEAASALTGALLGLARAPRPATDGAPLVDVALVARQVVALLAPAVAHRGVALTLESAESAPTAADPIAARAALALTLLAASERLPGAAAGAPAAAAPASSAAELAGAKHADDLSRWLRCTLSAGSEVTAQVAPAEGFSLPDEVGAVLRAAGADVGVHGDVVTITFRAAGGGA